MKIFARKCDRAIRSLHPSDTEIKRQNSYSASLTLLIPVKKMQLACQLLTHLNHIIPHPKSQIANRKWYDASLCLGTAFPL